MGLKNNNKRRIWSVIVPLYAAQRPAAVCMRVSSRQNGNYERE